MKITALPQFTRDARRFKEIISILVKYGLAQWLETHEPGFIKRFHHKGKAKEISTLTVETRIRLAMTELGPTFIKLGQIMSTREDLVGPGLAKELEQLQESTPADPPETIISLFKSELKSSPEKLFKTFDPLAMASASIGQIHGASLENGREVVVKLQHQGIEKKIATDFDILLALADLAEKHDENIRNFQPKKTLAEFKRNLARELDFKREQRNLEKFRQNFTGDASVYIPEVYPHLSTRRVLTMERLNGYSISDLKRLKQENIDTRELAKKGANIFLEMIFRDGFYHADPHPGNIWVLLDGKIGLLDCGMVGYIDEHTRNDLEEMLMAAAGRDADRITDIVLRIGRVRQEIDRNGLRMDISEFVSEHISGSLKDFNLSSALQGLTAIIRKYRIQLPTSVSMLMKVLVMLEGTSRMLDRNFNLAELLLPYQIKAMKRRYSPGKILHRMQRAYRDWDRMLEILPGEVTGIVEQIREGRFDIHLEHRRLDTIINRLVYGILTAALFMGSCRLLGEQIPPMVGGVSLFGTAGCLVAAGLGIRLLWAIKKSGNLDP